METIRTCGSQGATAVPLSDVDRATWAVRRFLGGGLGTTGPATSALTERGAKGSLLRGVLRGGSPRSYKLEVGRARGAAPNRHVARAPTRFTATARARFPSGSCAPIAQYVPTSRKLPGPTLR